MHVVDVVYCYRRGGSSLSFAQSWGKVVCLGEGYEPSKKERIIVLHCLHVYHQSPNSGDRQSKSRFWKRRFDPGKRVGVWGQVPYAHKLTACRDLPTALCSRWWGGTLRRGKGWRVCRTRTSLALPAGTGGAIHRFRLPSCVPSVTGFWRPPVQIKDLGKAI